MQFTQPPQIKNKLELWDCCDPEIVVGLVCAVGTDYKPIQECLTKILIQYGYKTQVIRISGLIPKLTDYRLASSPEIERIRTHMDAGNYGCHLSGRKDLWALAAVADINTSREKEELGKNFFAQKPRPHHAHLLLTLKRPEEVATLRKIYGDGFYLIGVFATEKERLDFLINSNVAKQDAADLIKRDANETDEFGQHTSATFHLSDVFVQLRNRAYERELDRFFQLIFSSPFVTPTKREHAMFLAYSSSLRSGQLGRQVGAAITSRAGDVVSVGCNDVPKPGGGLYWPDSGDQRDHIIGYDTNDRQREKMSELLIGMAGPPGNLRISSMAELKAKFRGALDFTEYGRAVHAEMDAILTCARSGVSTVGCTLYTTTFPCHNCTRHIIAAGIERVIYIEPYAKSRAEELHEDAIVIEEKARENGRTGRRKVPFTPFVGVGPRRYFDLFSLHLSRGFELVRKSETGMIKISRQETFVRVPMSPLSYIQREAIAIQQLESLPKQLGFFETDKNQ